MSSKINDLSGATETKNTDFAYEIREKIRLMKLLLEWKEEYFYLSGFGRDFEVDINGDDADYLNIKTSKLGFSEIITHVCDHVLECGANKVDVSCKCTMGELRLIITARTGCRTIVNSVDNASDYALSCEPVDHAHKRILCAYERAADIGTQIIFDRNEHGEEHIELVFDRVDIGELGFKANSIDPSLRLGIDLARERADRPLE